MGSDKALLKFGECSLLEYQIQKIRSLGISDIIISGHHSDCSDIRCVEDIIPGKGPLSGLHASLKASCNDCSLVLSVDVPLIPSSWLIRLIDSFVSSGKDVLLISHEGKAEPLIGIYKKSLADKIEKILHTERTAVFSLLDSVGYSTFEYIDNPDFLLNCNYPEDYERLLSILKV